MAQTTLPSDIELDEQPQAMLFDGWGFVPLPEAAPIAPGPEAEIPTESQAA